VAFIVVLLVAVATTACLGVKTPPLSRPEPPSIFVDYHRSGGFAGLDDRLVIFDNGIAILSRKNASTEIHMNQTDLTRITGIFSEAQYSLLQESYTARRGAADYFRYTISYDGKKVIAEDSAVPPSLLPVIAEMNRIISIADSAERIDSPFAELPS
jgi:hypothetical protein